MSSSDDRLKRSFQESIALFRLRNENVLKALKLRDVKFRTVWPLTVMNGAKERVHKKLDDNGFNNRPFRVSRLILQRIRRVNLGPHLIMQLRDRGGDPHSRARLTKTHISGSTPTKTTRKNLEFLRRARNSWNRAAAMPCCPVRFYRESLSPQKTAALVSGLSSPIKVPGKNIQMLAACGGEREEMHLVLWVFGQSETSIFYFRLLERASQIRARVIRNTTVGMDSCTESGDRRSARVPTLGKTNLGKVWFLLG